MNKKLSFFTIAGSALVVIALALLYFFIYNGRVPFLQSVVNQCTIGENADGYDHTHDRVADLPASKTGITIVFDLHGVLLGVDAKKAFSEIGLSSILNYSSAFNISFSHIEHELTKKVYAVFNAIQPGGNDCNALDPYGHRMPGLMCDWQRGIKSNSELKVMVEKGIDAHPEWFTTDIEKQLMHKVIAKMFIPEQLVSTIKIIPEGLHFVKKCKNQGHTLIIASNWDAESFKLLQKKFPDFFMLFDGVIISGITHKIKPSREAYVSLIERKKKYHEDIVFIDDQKENVDAARALGLHGILCTSKPDFLGFTSTPDFVPIEKELALVMKNKSVKLK